MVPDDFHDYFVASASVAGALIGLLFVAISVHPEQFDEGRDASARFRPSSALSALLNPLMLSLLLLVPGIRVGGGIVVVGSVGVVAVLALLVGVVPQILRPRRGSQARSIALLVSQGAIYAVEIREGVRMLSGAEPVASLQTLCVLIIVLFVIGIERAWEFVGAKMPGLLTALTTLRHPHGGRRTGDGVP